MISDEVRGACVSSICTMSRTVIPNNKPQYRRVYRRLDDHVMPVRSERITPRWDACHHSLTLGFVMPVNGIAVPSPPHIWRFVARNVSFCRTRSVSPRIRP